jgi:hypothetical protein
MLTRGSDARSGKSLRGSTCARAAGVTSAWCDAVAEGTQGARVVLRHLAIRPTSQPPVWAARIVELKLADDDHAEVVPHLCRRSRTFSAARSQGSSTILRGRTSVRGDSSV